MKLKAFFRNIDYRHYVCAGITVAFVLVNIFCFPYTFPRLGEALRDFGLSIAFFFTEMFGFSVIVPSVPALSKMPFTISDRFPETWEAFKVLWNTYWKTWANSDTVVNYFLSWRKGLLISSYVLTFLIPIFGVLIILLRRQFNKQNNDYNVDSKPLRIFKKISDKTYRPVKAWIIGFKEFVKSNYSYVYIWLMIALLSFNIVTIVFEFVAYYYYLAVSFDVGSLYLQVYKLLLDLSVIYKFVPLPVWIVLALIIYDKIRKNRGYDNLNHMELKNKGFIKERPIVSMICGSMGKGKTTVSTDMSLSIDVMMREEAFNIIMEIDLMFPYFPWINLENSLKRACDLGKVYNLFTARKFLRTVHSFYDKSKGSTVLSKCCRRRLKKVYGYNCSTLLFDYDESRYPKTYNNGLYILDIWTALEDYIQAYFLYVMSSSYIQSNYSIRTDFIKSDLGNLPLWDTDFFKRNPYLLKEYSRNSHVINFDALKLGKTLVENNNNNYFEFGVVSITEIGKERGNNLELQDVDKQSDEGNQKNDLFNAWLKMIRHSSTIYNYPFVKVICDEQRPESWGADARDLCQIIHIKGHSEQLLSMPGFFVEEIIHEILKRVFDAVYSKYRYQRGDNTFLMYAIKSIYVKFHGYYERIYNTFGYKEYDVGIEDGTQEGGIVPKTYYIMSKKIYSKRFSTDCFSNVFEERVSKAKIGIKQVPEFRNENASFDEMDMMQSYFFRELTKIRNNKTNDEGKLPSWVKKQLRRKV